MARIDEAKLKQILTLLDEIKTDVNALRSTFLAHDHGGPCAANSICIHASQFATITGTSNATAVAGSVPSDVYSQG